MSYRSGSSRLGWRANHTKDDGASLVEFALLLPLLMLLLLGIIEFGYFFGEYNDVRHGAREGARLAAVNAGDNSALRSATCDAMDLTTSLAVQFSDSATGEIGTTGTVTVVATPQSLSGLGFIELFLPSDLESEVEFRLEQDSDDWNSDGAPVSC